MVKPVITWILVADAARARIVENGGVGFGINPVAGAEFANEIIRSRDVYADRPGRVQESANQARHAMERPSDPKVQSAVAFARELAAYLNTGLRRKSFDRLVLIAEPSFLGHLRQALAKPVAGVVHAELAKDLTRETDADLTKHLESVLAV